MDTAQFKKFGAIILALGVLAVLLHFVWTKDPLHLYIGGGAAGLGLVLLVLGLVKK